MESKYGKNKSGSRRSSTLEPHDNRLTVLGITNGHVDSDLKVTALSAANRSYAPYSHCPTGVALVDCEGRVYRGW
ncbi:hypothetical protein IGI04_014335 [Brassica rapa subsp. trilocularis]|uniref:CMP/dCMP-type deaminase domain-containing protein n=1 Tax=Brassica rapa subsp. trilocularis TaxID=1813537 RepID=A0ABQ7MLX8_BRACM|nr:hypothetical protein IGI04_014335 [Brassica rapa subsp. trilocularis]